MKKFTDICYNNKFEKSCNLDVLIPDCDTFPVFVYFHGGGLEAGDKSDCKFYDALVEKKIAIVTANYRMYPQAKCPDFLEDGASVVKWVYDNMKIYGNVTSVFVGGSSAGGYMSQMLCFDKKYLAKHGIDSDEIDGYIHDAGQPTTHFNVLRERGIDTRRVIIDEAAPVFHICDNRDYSPMQIIVSDNDMQNRYQQTELLVNTLKIFGAKNIDYRVMQNSSHCAYIDKQDEKGNWIFAEMIYEFINCVTNEANNK